MDPNQHEDPIPDPSWVGEVLRAQEAPSMPSVVREQVLAALRTQQELREYTDFHPEAEVDELVELENSTNLGSFGPNAPTRLTPDGLGLG